ncbi:MAG: sigma-70 family RNA polymerase sigma factor [Actinomycetota bacterium]|nr:sigma-70 family RNA polymerase sigma factor [Actinomycetota bacterium]
MCLHGELKRYLRDYAWAVRPPRPIHDLYQQVTRATADLTHTLGTTPTISDIAHYLDVDPDQVRAAHKARTAYTAASLDALVQDHPDHLLFQLAPAAGAAGADTYDRVDLAVTIATLLRGLSPREQQIVGLRFGHELTQQEIGDRLGLSQMHVSRLLSSITARLRTQLTSAA